MQGYLKNTEQISITDNIKKIANKFQQNDLDLILEILNWIFNNFKDIENDKEEKIKLFRKRTAEEIIKSKKVTGCTDYAVIFISLARARGIPTKYVEAVRKKWLDIGDGDHIEGHVFAECQIKGKWYIIDPQEGAIRADYRRYVVYKKGLDSWSIGIRSFENLRERFLDFKKRHEMRSN
jgi:transglutaminase-like putative cysteine protease